MSWYITIFQHRNRWVFYQLRHKNKKLLFCSSFHLFILLFISFLLCFEECWSFGWTTRMPSTRPTCTWSWSGPSPSAASSSCSTQPRQNRTTFFLFLFFRFLIIFKINQCSVNSYKYLNDNSWGTIFKKLKEERTRTHNFLIIIKKYIFKCICWQAWSAQGRFRTIYGIRSPFLRPFHPLRLHAGTLCPFFKKNSYFVRKKYS